MSPEPHIQNPAVCPDNNVNGQQSFPQDKLISDTPLDLPPDSFWVPKDQEIDWFQSNAVMERKGSTKLIMRSKNSATPNYIVSSHHQRSLSVNQKSKTSSIFGLRRRNLREGGKGRLVRSRSEPDRKWVEIEQVCEPGSPRVSCTGKVGGSKKRNGKRRTGGFWGKVKVVLGTGFLTNRVASKETGLVVKPDGFVGLKKRSESYGGNDHVYR